MTSDFIRELWFPTDRCSIAGHWTPPLGRDTRPIETPSTGEEIGRIARGQAADIVAAVAAAQDARRGARGRAKAAERGRVLARIGPFVRGRADDLAGIEATDVGKPLAQARADAMAPALSDDLLAKREKRVVHGRL